MSAYEPPEPDPLDNDGFDGDDLEAREQSGQYDQPELLGHFHKGQENVRFGPDGRGRL